MEDEHVVGSENHLRWELEGGAKSASCRDVWLISLELKMSGRHERLLRLREWIAKNTALTLTLTDAARITCLEPHYFSQVFREHVGQSFREWRVRYRIAWILLALDSGHQSLNDIVQASGYRDRRAFERAVKRLTGMTPGDLRRCLLRSVADSGSRDDIGFKRPAG
jgi:AraC-like DNA-binding protein